LEMLAETFIWIIVIALLIGTAAVLGKFNYAQNKVAKQEIIQKKTHSQSSLNHDSSSSTTTKKDKKKQKKQGKQQQSEKKKPQETKSKKKVSREVPFGTKGVRSGIPAISQAMAARKGATTKKKVDLSDLHPHFTKEGKREPRNIALQFGLLYRNTEYELEGCINDLKHITAHFLSQTGFVPDNIVPMTDDTKIVPTKQVMESSMHQFVNNAINGDRLFLQYSGHGTSVKDKTGDEDDGYDEALCPLDGGVIVDDWMFFNVVKPLERAPTASLFVLIDACHSGTCLDLQHQYQAIRKPKETIAVREDKNVKRTASCQVIGFSAALDSQTATDIQDRVPQGAFTEMFIEVFQKHQKKPLTWRQFLLNVDGLLAKRGYAQQASVSSSRKLTLDAECRFW